MSQVTPGGGVLKLTLYRKGPLRITTEAQNKRPDPSQTTIKTVYEPTKEKGPLQGGENIEVKTTSRRGKSFEGQKIKPRKAPNDKRDASFPGDGGPVRKINPGGDGNSDGNEGPNRKPPRKGEEPPNGIRGINGVKEDQILVMIMEMEVDLPLHHQKILHLQEESIGGPGLFMYYRDLLGHQVKWDSQDKQVEMEGMARHPN